MPDRTEENEEIKALRKILSDNIRFYRKELHLTQEALAEAADISLSYLADIEHCKTWISDKTLLKLSKSLHKTPFELFIEGNLETEKTNIKKISDIIYDEKRALL
ncbi:MAG: helix-turn-helix transcriptional regulator, partial [Treponema sp.]|nr:helix-turn-helix transcriptional regulator [Treponema sp.]